MVTDTRVIESALFRGRQQLIQADIAEASIEARLLMMYVTGMSYAQLIMHTKEILSVKDLAHFEYLIKKRISGCPVAYLIGKKAFWSLEIRVDDRVLIPRADTELLIEQVLAISNDAHRSILDLGTGSGAIALALALEFPEALVVAVDQSQDALSVATHNAVLNEIENVTFLQSDWFTHVTGRFDLIVSNPPYIAAYDVHLDDRSIQFEPQTALVSGPTGLEALEVIIEKAPDYLNYGGWLCVEHGYDQGEAVRELYQKNGYADVHTQKDLGDNERITYGKY